MSEEKNSEVFLRPRFEIDVEESEQELMQRFRTNLNADDCKYSNKIVDQHIVIDVPFDEDHFWSPQLHIEIVKGETSKSVVKGLFGPKPQVWTLFIFLHFAVGITFLIFSTLLYVRWSFKGSLVFPTIMVVYSQLYGQFFISLEDGAQDKTKRKWKNYMILRCEL